MADQQPTQTKINKILIANRGEIAVRVIRACRDLGIPTVAVYSDADRTSLHVRYADEAVNIGPPAVQESYLQRRKSSRRRTKPAQMPFIPATAFYPKTRTLPRPSWMRVSCLSAQSRMPSARWATSKKPPAPWPKPACRLFPAQKPGLNDEQILEAAKEIGFPLMVKASPGGGGKGMRAVYEPEDLLGALKSARREAKSAFGDGMSTLRSSSSAAVTSSSRF